MFHQHVVILPVTSRSTLMQLPLHLWRSVITVEAYHCSHPDNSNTTAGVKMRVLTSRHRRGVWEVEITWKLCLHEFSSCNQQPYVTRTSHSPYMLHNGKFTAYTACIYTYRNEMYVREWAHSRVNSCSWHLRVLSMHCAVVTSLCELVRLAEHSVFSVQ
jgi:hypothetical protein